MAQIIMKSFKGINLIIWPLLFAVLFWEPVAFAYNLRTENVNRSPWITSVLGEPRTYSCPILGNPCRFHEGIDAAGVGFGAGARVNPIEAGTVIGVGLTSVDIESETGRIFSYMHVVDQRVANGDIVSTSSVIALIQDLGDETHLHMEEVQDVGGVDYALNPQRPGALDFIDEDLPQFVDTTIGGVTGKVIPVKEYTTGEDGTNPAPEVLPRLSDGSYLASGKIDLLVAARDGAQRKGVYTVGVTVSPKENPGYSIYSHIQNIRFDSILDNDPYTGIKTIYLRRNSDSDVYFGTNHKENFSPTTQTSEYYSLDVSDSRFFPDGQYEACAYIYDYPDAPANHYQDSCVDFIRPNLISVVV